eukprot:COSAG05_NODE_10238_length_576_cov_0.966457_1_plen_135_part_10
MVNPHVESGILDTTYSMNSLLESARSGDRLSFVPMYTAANRPSILQRLASAILISAKPISDSSIDAEVRILSATMQAKFGGHAVVSPGFRPDVWNISFVKAVPAAIVPSTLVSVDSMASEGSVIRDSVFNFSTGA